MTIIPILPQATLESVQQAVPLRELATALPVAQTVLDIIGQVRREGDEALRMLARRFGGSEQLTLPASEIDAAIARVSGETRAVLATAAANIRRFAEATVKSVQPVELVCEGYSVGMDFRPVERVGCYVPGGRYPLPSTALMTAITAQVAGVPEICICSPGLTDEVIYAGTLAGVGTFYQMGGAQAVAALAFGTQTVQSVDMVVGPGNAYVTEAKRQLQGLIGIDMLAGPSEVVVIADAGGNAEWIALDMLAQAEHDPDARTYLLTPSIALAHAVNEALSAQLDILPVADFLRQSLAASGMFVMQSLCECIQASDWLAPEHLELHVADPVSVKNQLKHYGAVFMGYQATVPFGDYLAGPNHTLPTARAARFSGSLNPLTFLRAQSWLHPTGNIRHLAEQSAYFAGLEGLVAHQAAAKARLLPE